ncbi:MAG: phosphoglucomutase/phosphomannomutase family protein [Pegethrix bostrychoides GSE-TBD4-15B]|jgi:phosphomannomutase|uniref:Phosphoglucomutase/phosphomannomutase family protein n=1 Tax=Pegethrix bostrychoides GSE-TBD4-15B TaxID=2839662 RepID=A0A951P8I8_9CYAN|nr:phosphoglucomutase/phosphomannomutase family protein [Pegethrix bostrychoides GSE-TBD4-15B]
MAAQISPASLVAKPIAFGTDGWRGVIAADFTFERVMQVAPLAAQALAQTYGGSNRTVIVGYDRRFLAAEFAQAAAESISAAGFEVLLSEGYAPTPAFSWAAKQQNALGAIVITASHNPGIYSGLKVKGGFGGSVPPEVTQKIEAMLQAGEGVQGQPGTIQSFDPWQSYCDVLRTKVDIAAIQSAIRDGKLKVFVDVMHGAAATGFSRILGELGTGLVELSSDRDPLFEGGAPEPLPRYLGKLFAAIQAEPRAERLVTGLVFDGDSDRVAAADGAGNFLSSQVLIPILIQHLAVNRGYGGEVIKTISGSNLIPKVAALYDLPIHQTPIGYKYIADRMLEAQVLLGGEESGGIGYGHHIPERDALLSALYVLEAVVASGKDLSQLYADLQAKADYHSTYDRIDLPLASMEVRGRLLQQLQTQPPTEIAGQPVTDCLAIDGYKFQLADQSWLLIRFSGTEPVLRLYSEALTAERVQQNLLWAKDWASAI